MATNSEDGALVLCGAKSKRNRGMGCRQPAMANGKCRLHGGKSTGPRSKKGRIRCGKSNYRHGRCTKMALDEHRQTMSLIKMSKYFLSSIN